MHLFEYNVDNHVLITYNKTRRSIFWTSLWSQQVCRTWFLYINKYTMYESVVKNHLQILLSKQN